MLFTWTNILCLFPHFGPLFKAPLWPHFKLNLFYFRYAFLAHFHQRRTFYYEWAFIAHFCCCIQSLYTSVYFLYIIVYWLYIDVYNPSSSFRNQWTYFLDPVIDGDDLMKRCARFTQTRICMGGLSPIGLSIMHFMLK